MERKGIPLQNVLSVLRGTVLGRHGFRERCTCAYDRLWKSTREVGTVSFCLEHQVFFPQKHPSLLYLGCFQFTKLSPHLSSTLVAVGQVLFPCFPAGAEVGKACTVSNPAGRPGRLCRPETLPRRQASPVACICMCGVLGEETAAIFSFLNEASPYLKHECRGCYFYGSKYSYRADGGSGVLTGISQKSRSCYFRVPAWPPVIPSTPQVSV